MKAINNSKCSEMTHSDTGSIKGNSKLMTTLANTYRSLLRALYITKRSTHSNLIRKLFVLLYDSHCVWNDCDSKVVHK